MCLGAVCEYLFISVIRTNIVVGMYCTEHGLCNNQQLRMLPLLLLDFQLTCCTKKAQNKRQEIDMGAVISVVWQGISCPVTTIFILVTCWVWVKLFVQDWDPRHLTASYTDVAQRKQYWRVFAANFAHSSILMMLLNASLIWSVRTVEVNHGSLFIIRYTPVLLISQTIIANAIVYILLRTVQNPDIRQMISNTNTMGASNLVLSWLAYLSVTYSFDSSRKYLMFGFFNIHPAIAPLVVIFIYLFTLPMGYAYSNFGALMSGYLLAAGVLQVLPDAYWSTGFLLDVVLIVAVSILFRESGGASTPIPEQLQVGDVLEVVEIGPARLTDGGLPTSSDLRDLLGFGRRSPVQEQTRAQSQQEQEHDEEMGASDEELMEEGEFYGSESTPLLRSDDLNLTGSGSVRSLLAAERQREGTLSASQLTAAARRSNGNLRSEEGADLV